MKRIQSIFICIILSVLLLFSCEKKHSQPQNTSTRTITDAVGRQVTIPTEINSVVCVGVGALRFTCHLQAQDLVVGIEDYEKKQADLHRLYNYVNFSRFQNLPTIGGNGEPYPEAIIELSPDLIIFSQIAKYSPDDLQKKTGTPVVVIPGMDFLLDQTTFNLINLLGEVLNKQERATFLIQYLNSLKEDLTSRTQNIPNEEKPSVYVCGVSFAGHHGFEGTEANYGPFAIIGAKNLANSTGQPLAFNIDPEQVLEWDPDVIFIDYNGLSLIQADYQKRPNFYKNFTAIQQGKVYSQFSYRSYATNLDTGLANTYYAAKILYPEQFSDIDLDQKISEIYMTLLGADPSNDLKENGYAFAPIQIDG